MSSERPKMKKFEEGLAFYICNQLASSQLPIKSYISEQLKWHEWRLSWGP